MNSSEKPVKSFAESLLHFLWPVNCPVCGRPAEIICPECAKQLFADEVIERHFNNLKIFSAAWYHTAISEIIAAFKYAGLRAICRPLGRAMAEFIPKPEADCLVPVPLHLKSKRPYNQALELAKGMSDIWGIKIFDGAEWSREMPNRAGLNANERMRLTADAFVISQDIKALNVAIIDDVCTTGMTLARFSQACEFFGAHTLGAYTLATVSEL